MIEIIVAIVVVLGIGIGYLVISRKKKLKSKDDIYPMWQKEAIDLTNSN